MKPAIEKYIGILEEPIELPEKVVKLPNVIPELPDITPVEVIEPITDIQSDDCNEAINNLVTKYKKIK